MATINIQNNVSEINNFQALQLVEKFLTQRPPEKGSFDYGLISFGVLDITFIGGCLLTKPIHVRQDGKRKSAKSPINIKIEYHQSLF